MASYVVRLTRRGKVMPDLADAGDRPVKGYSKKAVSG
jgi:hypothetical protein